MFKLLKTLEVGIDSFLGSLQTPVCKILNIYNVFCQKIWMRIYLFHCVSTGETTQITKTYLEKYLERHKNNIRKISRDISTIISFPKDFFPVEQRSIMKRC